VTNVINVLNNDYINPFSANISKDTLVNLSSGVELEEDVSNAILNIYKTGQQQYECFVKERIILGRTKNLQDTIKRNKLQNFSTNNKIKNVPNKTKGIEINRDILAKMLFITHNKGKVIDFQKALCKPLSEVPLSLANPDGSMRKTDKSKLAKVILSRKNETKSKICFRLRVLLFFFLISFFLKILIF